MAFKDYKPERKELDLKSTKASLRGLSVTDVTRLIINHLPDIELAAARMGRVRAQVFSRAASDEFFIGLCTDAPLLIAEVISVAADEADDPEALANIASLPAGLQTKALGLIFSLTVEEAGDLKNLFASLSKAVLLALGPERLAEIKTLAGMRLTPSPSSIGAFAET